MKKIYILLFGLITALFVSCGESTTSSVISEQTTTSNLITSGFTTNSKTTTTSQNSSGVSTTTILTNQSFDLNVLSINDTHGYMETSSNNSLSKIANYFSKYDSSTSLKISVGDMFQGTSISNLTKGKAMIDVLNQMDLDCMVVGNHEFDWGIETILEYFDGDQSNGEANFKLLAANIVDKNGNMLKNTSPYIIKEINGYKIGVIGLIGDTLESSISASKVKDYDFISAKETAEKYSAILNNDLNCDSIIIATHCGTENNDDFINTGADLILNAHSHLIETEQYALIPYMQSSSYARYLGHTVLTLKHNNSNTLKSLKNISIKSISNTYKPVDDIVEQYTALFNEIINENIARISNFSKPNIASYSLSLLEDYFNVDYAFFNMGGFRTNWSDGNITYSDLMEMVPFDNEIKVTTLTGASFKKLIMKMNDGYDLVSSFNYSVRGSHCYIDGVEIKDTDTFRVAACDYVFDKDNYSFLEGSDTLFTGEYLRDLLYTNFKEIKNVDLSNYNGSTSL